MLTPCRVALVFSIHQLVLSEQPWKSWPDLKDSISSKSMMVRGINGALSSLLLLNSQK